MTVNNRQQKKKKNKLSISSWRSHMCLCVCDIKCDRFYIFLLFEVRTFYIHARLSYTIWKIYIAYCEFRERLENDNVLDGIVLMLLRTYWFIRVPSNLSHEFWIGAMALVERGTCSTEASSLQLVSHIAPAGQSMHLCNPQKYPFINSRILMEAKQELWFIHRVTGMAFDLTS